MNNAFKSSLRTDEAPSRHRRLFSSAALNGCEFLMTATLIFPPIVPLNLSLSAHPACAVAADWRVSVGLELADDARTLSLRYQLPATGVRFPTIVKPRRADDLWKTTCAELFVAQSNTLSYREFNFSPSGEWAAYDFAGYRQRTDVLPELPTPGISVTIDGDVALLSVALPLDCLPAPGLRDLCFSTTVVVQAQDGALSYWAASHSVTPDFHLRNSFIVSFAAGQSHS